MKAIVCYISLMQRVQGYQIWHFCLLWRLWRLHLQLNLHLHLHFFYWTPFLWLFLQKFFLMIIIIMAYLNAIGFVVHLQKAISSCSDNIDDDYPAVAIQWKIALAFEKIPIPIPDTKPIITSRSSTFKSQIPNTPGQIPRTPTQSKNNMAQHIVEIFSKKASPFHPWQKKILLSGVLPQHLSVWKDNLKRLRTNSVLLHLITNFLLHKHENTSHDYSQCLVMREKFVNWSKRQVTMCSWRKRQRRGLNSPLIALSTASPLSLSS